MKFTELHSGKKGLVIITSHWHDNSIGRVDLIFTVTDILCNA